MRSARALGPLAIALILGACKPEDTDTGDTSDTSDTDTADTDTADTADTDTADTAGACVDDTNEPDDDTASANALAVGVDATGQICADDSDWFGLSATAGCVIDAHLDFDEAAADLDLYLYDAAADLVDYSESASFDEAILYANAGAAAQYYLEVVGYLGAEASYTLGYGCKTSTCTDDDNEPDDTLGDAEPLVDGAPQGGQICLADDDWYAIELAPGCDAEVLLTFNNGNGDLDLYLVDADEAELDASESTTDTETVYAIVHPYEDAEGPYEISVTLDCPADCTDDGAEDDDDSTNANDLVAGAAATGAQICAFDEDWYTFTGTAGCDGEVTLSFADVDGDLDLALYDDSLVGVAGSSGTGDVEVVRYNLRGQGATNEIYYAVVTGFGEAQNDYTIALVEDCAVCSDDAGDNGQGDDDATHANSLDADTEYEGAICADDVDWFAVAGEGDGCKVTATLDFVHDDGDLDLFLVDDQGVEIESSTGTTDHEALAYRLTSTDPTAVFLRVEGYAAAEGPYTLWYDVDCTPCTDAAEPNDVHGDAHGLTPGTPFEGDQCDDDDWYTFTAGPYCEGQVVLTFDGAAADLDLALYSDPTGTADDTSTLDAPEVVWFDNNGATGVPLWVLVEYWSGFEPPYSLDIVQDCTACVADAGTDDVSTGATALAKDAAPVSAEICTGDDDWYTFQVAAGCTADVLLEFEHAAGDLDLSLYANPAAAADSESASEDDDEGVGFVNDTAGAVTLYAQVYGYAGADAPYAISWDEVCACTDDVLEQNDSLATATPIGADSTTTAQICGDETTADDDWFSFTAPARCTIDVRLDLFDEWGDLDLYLVDETEYLLDWSEYGGDLEEVTYDVGPDDEALYLVVMGYFDLAPGENGNGYTLTVDTTCPP